MKDKMKGKKYGSPSGLGAMPPTMVPSMAKGKGKYRKPAPVPPGKRKPFGPL
jgi:hypothetical protein